MTHAINQPGYARGFRIAWIRPTGLVQYLDEAPMPATAQFEEVFCREVPLRPPQHSFRVWSVNHRGTYWVLAVWQWPPQEALDAASLLRFARDGVIPSPNGRLVPLANGEYSNLQKLYEMAWIAAEFDRRPAPPEQGSLFAYALSGPRTRDWTMESMSLRESYVRVITGDVTPPWNTMEDAWDAGMKQIEQEALRSH